MLKKIAVLAVAFFMMCFMGLISFAENFSVEASFVQEDGEWIYYLDDTDFGNLYKVKKDGTYQSQVSEIQAAEFLIVGDWVYYIKSKAIFHGEGDLYRIRKDGTENQLLFKDELWPVIDLEYSNGYLTFNARNMFKMAVNDLIPVDLSEWRHWPADNRNGYLIETRYNYNDEAQQFNLYNLSTGETSYFNIDKTIDNAVYDDEWIYFLEDIKNYKLVRLVKVDYKGENKQIVVNDIPRGENLQLVDDHLYYFTVASSGVVFKRDVWRISTLDGLPELFINHAVGNEMKFEKIIDEIVYFRDNYYLGNYDMQTETFKYKSFPKYMGDAFAAISDANSIYVTDENAIVELTAELVEKERFTNLTSLDGDVHEIKPGARVFLSGDNIAITGNWSEDMIVNLKNKTIYGLSNKDDDYFIAGIDKSYVYIYGEKNENRTNKFYRLPIGEKSLAKKEHIWDVSEVEFHEGYVIDMSSVGSSYAVKVMNLSTLEIKEVSTASANDTFVLDGNIYYSSSRNGNIYKSNINNSKPKAIFSKTAAALDFVVTKDAIYTFVWKDGIQFIKTDLDGSNYKAISTDVMGTIYGVSDRYILFDASRRWASYSVEKKEVEMISDLYKNFKQVPTTITE